MDTVFIMIISALAAIHAARAVNVPNSDWLCRNCAGVSQGRGWQALQVVD